jgi:saccharopine dehydrogenase-like NADP-dependent oxidoreductase
VLGATGFLGRRTTAELSRHPDVTGVIASARDGGAAARVAKLLGGSGGKVSALTLDVTDETGLIRAARDVDVIVGCAGPAYLLELSCARAAIDAGTHYVSLNDDHPATERVNRLDGDARDAGVTIVSGCGFSPGITNLLVALAGDEVDAVEEIAISIAVSSADGGGPAGALHFVTMMGGEAPAISDHEPDGAPAATSPKLVFFPEPVGWVETFRCGHPEVITLPQKFPDLSALHCRMGLTERAVMDTLRASLATGLLATDRSRRAWLRMSEPMRPFFEALPPRGAAWTAARVDVRGSKDGRTQTISYGVVDHLVNLGSIPLARAAVELATRKGGGVLAPEQLFEPKPFLNALVQRGIRLARLEPHLV